MTDRRLRFSMQNEMMTANLNPYPAYKPSGVSWLGDVPIHWNVAALRHRYSQGLGKMLDAKRRTGNNSLPYLRNVDVQWDHINVRNLPEMDIVPSEYDRYTVQAGDLLVCEGGEVGRCALWLDSTSTYGFQKALHRLRPRDRDQDMVRFMYYVLCVAANNQAFIDGHISTIGHLTGDKLRAHRFPFPSYAEQATIVRFLDHIEWRIRRYIGAKQKRIALLHEQKQAIIDQAVAGQIDVRTGRPYAGYKASGVELLGEVPEHWELRRLKFVASISSGQVDPRLEHHRHKVLIAPNHIARGGGIITELETGDTQGAESGKYEVRVGDVVYSKIRPNLRKVAISPVDGLCSADMYPIRVRESDIRAELFLYLMLSSAITKYAVDCSMRVAMPKVNREALGDCWLCYPRLPEQRAIVRWIQRETASCGWLIERTQREIGLIREFRTRIVADVVTGKLDVRDVCVSSKSDVPSAEDSMDDHASVDCSPASVRVEMKDEAIEA